jgi:GNAT superfamily N-acetyltransferase
VLGPPSAEPRSAWRDDSAEQGEVLVALDQNVVTGFARFGGRAGAAGELAALYVAPAHQGGGVGTALWNAVARRLSERGCTELRVWTLARAPARDFYLARGMAEVDTGTITVAGHVEPAVCLRAVLGPATR